MTIRLQDYRPDELAAIDQVRQCARFLLDAGCSATQVAGYMLHAAYELHATAHGADAQAEGWQERADRGFQQAVAGFCVEAANAGITEAGDVLLPYLEERRAAPSGDECFPRREPGRFLPQE